MNVLPIKHQQGYIGMAVIAFLIVLSAILYPFKYPPQLPAQCIVGEPPGRYEILTDLPAIKDVFIAAESDLSGNEPIYGGPDPSEKAEYVLIRRKVPVYKKSIPEGWDFLGESSATDHTHTINLGELPGKPGYDAYYPSRWGEMDLPTKGRKYIRNMGLLMFADNNPASIKQQDGDTIYLLDVYQDKRIYDFRDKGYSEEDIFICGVDTKVGAPYVVSPAQSISLTRDQLQLEWFLFAGDKVWGIHCKPAVYLYPPEKRLVNVKVYPKGELSYTDPVYDPDKGWTVWAEPNGDLLSALSNQPSARKYDYLYYESKLLDSEIKKPTKGWVVRYESRVKNQESSEMKKLFDQILPELGLNEKEKKDFMNYWLNKLPDSPYYYVGLVEKKQRDYLEALEVTPNPDTSIRFSLYFEALDRSKVVSAPEIITPKRNGFTLVDWGGMVKLHPGTPFTCSQ